ncbi:MAG TPA: glycosyltransferase [Limnochordales bacterium]
MTIAFFSDSYTPYVSGVVQSIRLTAASLVRRGHRVVVVAPAYPRHAASGPDETGALVVRLPSLPAPGQPVFRLPLPWRRALVPLLQRPPSVVHAHSPFVTAVLARWVARRLRVPLLFTHHTLYHEYVHYGLLPGWALVPAILRRVGAFCRTVDRVIAPTPSIAAMLPRLYGSTAPVTVVPTGLDLRPFREAGGSWLRARLGLDPATPVVVHVGRLAREKNMPVLVQALRLILAGMEGCHAVVVGGGPFLAQLRQAAREPAFAGRLHVVGPVPPEAVPRYLAGASLFLTASTTETQGLVAVEAMAAGLPVVAPAAGGLPDVVTDGLHGVLTEPQPAALAEAALALLADAPRRQAMARRARERAGQFDVESTTGRLLEAYVAAGAAPEPAGT